MARRRFGRTNPALVPSVAVASERCQLRLPLATTPEWARLPGFSPTEYDGIVPGTACQVGSSQATTTSPEADSDVLVWLESHQLTVTSVDALNRA